MPSSARLSTLALELREQLRIERARIGQLHDAGHNATQVCEQLSALADEVVQRLLASIFSAMGTKVATALGDEIALVVHGGNGRQQSAPYSDVDLMILFRREATDDIDLLARKLTNGIFDAGLQLGQSLRSVNEAVELARADPIVCTSLIDSRLLAGNAAIYRQFRTQFEAMVSKRSGALAQSILDSRSNERDQYGESVYLLEPHVKRSRGGLRDLHLLRWLHFLEHGTTDPMPEDQASILPKLDQDRLIAARDFLLRVRNEMHFFAGKAKDMLNRAEQLRVAEKLGYGGTGGMLPVEQLMRDYFRHTSDVWQNVRRCVASLVPVSTVVRVLDPVIGKKLGDDYRIGIRHISATEAGLARLKSDLSEVLNLVSLSVAENKPLDQTTWTELLQAAPDYPEQLSEETKRRFLEILDQPQHVVEVLRMLHELGMLGKVIPAMRHARGLLQFNQYHKYTVDEHCLRAVLHAIRFADRSDSLGVNYRAVRDKRLVHLGLLLHDLGKGYDEDHSEVGRRLAMETAERLGLDPLVTNDLVFLVHRHLLLSHAAFRRDTSDSRFIGRFVDTIQSPERLRMLLVMTCADLAAVGPGVLTDWKIEVLDTLYRRAARLLKRDELPSTESKFEDLRQRIVKQFTPTEHDDPWFQKQLAALPQNYLTHRDPAEAAEALRRMHRLADGTADAWGTYLADTKTIEFVAAVGNGLGRGIFSSMAGVLSSQGMEILHADTEALADNLLLLRYVASDSIHSGIPTRERLDQICQKLIASVDSTQLPTFPRIWGQQQTEDTVKLTSAAHRVRIDNQASDARTVIEIFTFDRTGLLYYLARALHNLKLVIRQAKIATSLDQVVDVFYVTGQDGEKITDQSELTAIHDQLMAVIDADAAENAETQDSQ